MEKKDSKRVKITAKDILGPKSTILSNKIDMKGYYENQKKQREADIKRYKIEIEAEHQRLKNLECPCCKSVNKSPVRISNRNGPLIVGGRNSVSVLADYNVCQDCGVMYVDLNKKDIKKPESEKNYFF